MEDDGEPDKVDFDGESWYTKDVFLYDAEFVKG
jgi:hypothetical protein